MYKVQRVLDLPIQELAEMLVESKAADFRAIDRLINDWRTGANRFNCPGEALFLAKQENLVVGICGLNRDPYVNSGQIGRIRRLYVMQRSRRQGIGRTLVHYVIQAAKLSFAWLHVRTTSPIAAQFYRSLDFAACDDEFVTHALDLTTVHLKNLREDLPNAT